MFTFIITAVTIWFSILILGLARDYAGEMLFGGGASFLVGLFIILLVFTDLSISGTLFLMLGAMVLVGTLLNKAGY